MPVRGLFLDLYGTLTDGDSEVIASACREVVRDLDLPVPATDFAVAWGRHIWALAGAARREDFRTLADLQADSLVLAVRDLGADVDPRPYVDQLERHWRRPTPHPDVVPFLRQLRVPVCIVSNADRDNAERALEHIGVPARHLVTSEDARSYKPNPEIFRLAFEVTGWSPQDTMHVGDSRHGDVAPARALGLTAGLIRRHSSPWEPGGERAHHEFDHLAELLDFLHR